MQKQKNICVRDIPSVCPSFDTALEYVKEQIDYDCFPFEMLLQVNELAAIMAEIYRMRPEDKIPINGALRTISDVQSVYAKLGHEHIESVINTFSQIPYRVKNPKLYLRSMLYDELFKLEHAAVNRYTADTEGGA